jgi:protein-histidine pros-kinase
VTGNQDAGDREACLDAGMDGVVTKPFRQDDLLEAIERLVSGPAAAPAVASAGASTATRRALIVEDNAMNQRVIQAILDRAGFQTAVVQNGQEAVDYLCSEPCDVVLMDCQMPVMDGWEATRAIRDLESLGRLAEGSRSPLPVLAVTANAMEGDRERCLEAGMDEYLTKPIKPERLLAAIESFLARRPSVLRR